MSARAFFMATGATNPATRPRHRCPFPARILHYFCMVFVCGLSPSINAATVSTSAMCSTFPSSAFYCVRKTTLDRFTRVCVVVFFTMSTPAPTSASFDKMSENVGKRRQKRFDFAPLLHYFCVHRDTIKSPILQGLSRFFEVVCLCRNFSTTPPRQFRASVRAAVGRSTGRQL